MFVATAFSTTLSWGRLEIFVGVIRGRRGMDQGDGDGDDGRLPRLLDVCNEQEDGAACADYNAFPRTSCSHMLEDIGEEDLPVCLPLSFSGSLPYPPPEAPELPMEFLSRSWSISALEVAKALQSISCGGGGTGMCSASGADAQQHSEEPPLVTAPFSFASSSTAQLVMDRIMQVQKDTTSLTSRRNSNSSGPLSLFGGGLPPLAPEQAEELPFCRSFSSVRHPFMQRSMGRWLKDTRQKKKEAARLHNAQLHAAISVAGVAAAVASITAATAMAVNGSDDIHTKTSMAVASAAALVAAQCVEVAESMGAEREQVSSVVSSAVRAKDPGDVVTLTAAAATALRGAATLKARTLKEAKSHSTPKLERVCTSPNIFSGECLSEDSEAEYCSMELLRKGCKFLKRSKKGKLHWRLFVVFIDRQYQVIVKSRGEYLGGAITKEKKRLVQDVYVDMPAWPGRDILGEKFQRYFGIKTEEGVLELECKSEPVYRLWTDGILHLLSVSQRHRLV